MPIATDRFVFESRPLKDWLLQLVDEEASKRKAAAKVIIDQFYMPVGLLPDKGMEEFLAGFSSAVRNAVNRQDFPAVDFVRNLLALELALHESWHAKVKADSAREKEADRTELEKLGEHPTEADKKRYIRRIWIRLLRDCKNLSEEEPHEVFTTGMALIRVVESLGAELLPAADLLREMLFSKHEAYIASDAIGRMGREGLEFYGDLLEGLTHDDPNFYCSKALGFVLKAAPEKIPEILRLACESGGSSQVAAISAIATCARTVTEAFPDVEVRLRELLKSKPDEGVWYGVVVALGKCGRTSETVDGLLAHLDPADPEKCGVIMLALGDIAIEAERVVPRLTELLDTFKESDPDWCYHGEHERVVQALRGFGPLAVSAVPTLIRHVWTNPQQYWTNDQKLAERPDPDEEVIKLLGELGPVAKEALPVLNEVRNEMRNRAAEANNTLPDAEENATVDDEAYWNIAIKRVGGTALNQQGE